MRVLIITYRKKGIHLEKKRGEENPHRTTKPTRENVARCITDN